MVLRTAIVIGVLAMGFFWVNDMFGGFTSARISKFHPKDMPDLEGKVALVTGANTGIGYVTAKELAKKGAHVFFTVRSEAKGQSTAKRLAEELVAEGIQPKGKLEYGVMDLSSLQSVRDFAEKFLQRDLPLHILINNAGVIAPAYIETKEGLELQFGVNHLGHFYLFQLLEDALKRSPPARVVAVSSVAIFYPPKEGIRFETLDSNTSYGAIVNYSQSKLANVFFAQEAAARLNGTGVTVHSLHPGAIDTDLSRHLKEGVPQWLVDTFQPVMNTVLMTTEQGALNQLYVATMTTTEQTGLYFRPVGIPAAPPAIASDMVLQKKLWEVSEGYIRDFES